MLNWNLLINCQKDCDYYIIFTFETHFTWILWTKISRLVKFVLVIAAEPLFISSSTSFSQRWRAFAIVCANNFLYAWPGNWLLNSVYSARTYLAAAEAAKISNENLLYELIIANKLSSTYEIYTRILMRSVRSGGGEIS